MLTLKMSDPIMPLKPDLHRVLIFLREKFNVIIICSCHLTDLACVVDSDTHWMCAFHTSLCQCKMELIFFVVARQSTLLTRLENDCGASSAFLNAFDN